ncbi:chlorophyll synthesis pathway protein BchC [Rhodovibrio salinarum]|uniref:chlorophyll synthesis pathway protein BchC n=1 Tax=Rhodovibrio salinarum TaxID=1087 RepID=UPI0004B6FBF5
MTPPLNATAVVLEEPEKLALSRLDLAAPAAGDIVVDMEVSGISTGTERLLWTGQMPHFPGMGYPLVPGYEALGRVSQADGESGLQEGDRVFVPGARCFGDVRGLFGGAASRVVVPASRVVKVSDDLGEGGVLLALAATAYHALQAKDAKLPELIVGHGTLGRLLARVTLALGGESPVVWEADPARREGAQGYTVVAPEDDGRRDYSAIYDVSGDAGLLDELIGRLAFGGEVVLAGFYSDRPSFAFPQAFMREARIRIAAEWRESDLHATRDLAESGALSLDGLITHRRAATDAEQAYRTAFGDSACLKMVLDWRGI